MKREVRLYNVIFPVWLMFLFPQIWLIALPGNLVIDVLVLAVTLKGFVLLYLLHATV